MTNKVEMKKTCLTMMLIAGMTTAMAQETDSLRLEELQEVVVSGVWAPKTAPFAVENIKKQELQQFSTTGKELPLLFARTPGVLAWSENGVGTGTTYMRIRGAGDSRINVTLDGVPLNSPEDQCVFWANMNSYASLLGGVQIQRGVGSSSNGDGAFGGTIALSSKAPSEVPTAELTSSYGSYNTFRIGGQFSTGLLWNHLIFDAAYHETNTDGYLHGTRGRSGSYYGGLTWLGDGFTLRYKNIGNFERTGQAWNGVTAGNDDLSLMDGTYGVETGIKDYEDLYKAGLGRYNSLYEQLVFDDNGGYHTERYKLNDGSFWSRATDYFRQNHNILSAAWNINTEWSATASLHYTHGYGYYDEFRYQNKLKKFGLANITDAEGNTLVKKSDFVRKKGITQDAYGAVANINYKGEHFDVVAGFSTQMFKANHFGYLTYISDDLLREKIGTGYKYYDSDADKFDGNIYAKATYHISSAWDIFADMQYRFVNYKTDGVNDKFIDNGDGTYSNHRLDIDKDYNFFNPKGGVSFHKGNHRAYASFAMSNREPERNNFTDNGAYPAPKAERLFDYEAGYNYQASDYHFGINLYYMDYKDQFVKTGQVSDIGEALTTNIKKSYRMGMELSLGYDITSWLSIDANMTLSRNRIKDFDEYVDVDFGDGETRVLHYGSSTLAFSPRHISNGFVDFHYKGLRAVWHTNYVSRQYLDNTKNHDRSLPAYSVSNISLSYTTKALKVAGLKEIEVGADFNNIFHRHYATNGWVYSSILEEYGNHPNENRYYQIGFIPSAGFTAMAHLTLRW